MRAGRTSGLYVTTNIKVMDRKTIDAPWMFHRRLYVFWRRRALVNLPWSRRVPANSKGRP